MTDETDWKDSRLCWTAFVIVLVMLPVMDIADTIWERDERWYYFEQPLFDDLP